MVVIKDLAVLLLSVAPVDTLVTTRFVLARDIGLAIDHRQEIGAKVLASAVQPSWPDALVIA